MKYVLNIYLVMGHDRESDKSYPIKGFYTEDAAEKFKLKMKANSPREHFYWVQVEVLK